MTLEAIENQADQIATPVLPLAKKINAEALIGTIVTKGDFAEIDGKIEPTRDLALKLFTVAKLNYDTQLLSTQSVGNHVMIAVKARVYQDNRAQKKVAEGLGGCTTEETARSGKRAYHDALARAETRAFKRALEAAVGLPFINQIILRLFGGYAVGASLSLPCAEVKPELPNQGGIAENRLLEVLKSYIDKIGNARQLESWGKKYKDLVDCLTEEGRIKLRQHYAARRATLKPKPDRGANGGPSFEEILRLAKLASTEEDREVVQDLARELTPEQREEAERMLAELEQDYEDAVRESYTK
jgi:hypothetical protein